MKIENGQSPKRIKKFAGNQNLWVTILIAGLLLTVGASVAISYIQQIERFYILAGIIAVVLAVAMFFKPQLGAYILIITVFSNMSDLFTESNLPSINQPLVALMIGVVLANLIFAPDRLMPLHKITRIEWALFGYILVVIISYAVAQDKQMAYDAILRLLKNSVIFFTMFLTLNTRRKVRVAIRVLITTMAILVLLGVIQNFLGTDFTFFGLAQRSTIGQKTDLGTLRYGGPMGLSNVWGQVLVIVLPFFIYRAVGTKSNSIQKIALIISTVFIFLAVLLTGSRGAFVGMLLVLPLIAYDLRIKIPTIFIGLAVGTVVLLMLPKEFTTRFTTLLSGKDETGANITQDEAVIGRLTKMRSGMAMFDSNPFIGVGIGNYPTVYWDYAEELGFEPEARDIQSPEMSRDPHSLYIEVMSETGLLGITTFMLFFGFMLYDTFNVLRVVKGRLDDARWKNWIAPIFFSLVTYSISAIFLHGIVFRWFWLIAAIALSAIHLTSAQFKNT